jgi:hypothetical protein
MHLFPSYRHETVFTISHIQFLTKTDKNVHNIIDLRNYVRKENGNEIQQLYAVHSVI